MKKILCPTDFSDTAINAVAYAAKFAQATRSHLTLYNVQSLFDMDPVEILQGSGVRIQSVAQQLESHSNEVSRIFKISCDAAITPTVEPLSWVIEHKADEYDLVIMGSGASEDLYRFFAGSTTYSVMKHCKIPLIMVPPGYVYTNIDNIVYAYDYLSARRLPITQLLPWVKALSARFSVLDVVEEAHSEEAELDLRILQEIIARKNPDVSLHFETLHSGAIATSINTYMTEHNADMLALCTIQRNFLTNIFHKSVIRSISMIATYPVLVFHE